MRDTYVQVVVLSILPAYLKKKIYIYIYFIERVKDDI